jgi:hypothetical protein
MGSEPCMPRFCALAMALCMILVIMPVGQAAVVPGFSNMTVMKIYGNATLGDDVIYNNANGTMQARWLNDSETGNYTYSDLNYSTWYGVGTDKLVPGSETLLVRVKDSSDFANYNVSVRLSDGTYAYAGNFTVMDNNGIKILKADHTGFSEIEFIGVGDNRTADFAWSNSTIVMPDFAKDGNYVIAMLVLPGGPYKPYWKYGADIGTSKGIINFTSDTPIRFNLVGKPPVSYKEMAIRCWYGYESFGAGKDAYILETKIYSPDDIGALNVTMGFPSGKTYYFRNIVLKESGGKTVIVPESLGVQVVGIGEIQGANYSTYVQGQDIVLPDDWQKKGFTLSILEAGGFS